MATLLLWFILLVICWPLAFLALLAYPILWVVLLPFRLIGVAADGFLDLLRALISLPANVLRGPKRP